MFLKTENEQAVENVEAKLKQQAVLTTGPEDLEYSSREGSDITINTSEHSTSSRKSCLASRWIDKVCVVLFPMMYVGFNVGYWWYYREPKH